MAVTPFDSGMFRGLFGDTQIGQLLTDSAEVRALLLVEGALATAQGALGIIPRDSADFIQRAVMEVQIDPASLSKQTGQNAVVIPALVSAFHAATDAPEHAQYFHYGATSQDIIDTALILRLRQIITIFETRLGTIIHALGDMAQTHANLPMAGRTYGQIASPTSFGVVVASWGHPLISHGDRLNELKPRLLCASLSGAAGTLSMVGDKGLELRDNFAKSLKLNTPVQSWHSTRDTIAEFAGWMTLLSGSLGKIGEDLTLLSQSGIDEISLSKGGASSTMPQKSNPVLPSVMVALSTQSVALNSAIQSAMMHRQQRDGAAWFVEWLSLGQMIMATARSLSCAQELTQTITPNAAKMRQNLEGEIGLIYAEALSFALANHMPRPQAKEAVKSLCTKAGETGTHLATLAKSTWPEIEFGTLFTAAQQLGLAPHDAEEFAKRAQHY